MKKLILIPLFFITALFLTATAQYTKLLDFAGTTNGKNPLNSLISDGTFLYGMTYEGGTNNLGTIFKIKPDGTGYFKLLDFAGISNGSNPVGPLLLDGGMLYGLTAYGGINGVGTMFKIMPDGTGYNKLLDFAGPSNGSYPFGSLVSDGVFLYGMTYTGGINDMGTLFKIMPDGTGYTKLLDLAGTTNGSYPQGYLIFNGGFLFGMTAFGGANDMGTIFKIMPDGTMYSKLLDFDGASNGKAPLGYLISDGTFLYGMTSEGGSGNLGCLFKIMPDGTGYSKLLDFTGATNGGNPYGSLIAEGGMLYGMTTFGGTNNMGVIFKILSNGTGYAKVLDFSGADGNNPIGTLISDGTFLYGMAYQGGTNNFGAIFKNQIYQPVPNQFIQNYKAACQVIGQPDFFTQNTVASQSVTPAPVYAAVSASGHLAIADQTANRVLIWNSFPASDGQPADVVVGKANFTTTTSGVTQSVTGNCTGVAFSPDGKLLVCDATNRRVLVWNTIPTTNGQPADVVIGQVNFTTATTSPVAADKFGFISGIVVAPDGKLFIADQTNNRVLVFNTIPLANGAAADLVIGQPNFTTGTSGNTASKMNQPSGVCVSSGKLLVAEQFNNRVLVFNNIPIANNASADVVIGQTAFGLATSGSTSAKFNTPAGVSVSPDGIVAIADRNNSRILLFNSIPSTNGANADFVLGQPGFTTTTGFYPTGTSAPLLPTAQNMFFPTLALYDNNNNLTVVGNNMRRAMIYRFNAPSIATSGPTTFCSGGTVTLTASTGSAYLWSNGATTQSINVSIAGTYSVVVDGIPACRAVTVIVTGGAAPVITPGGPTTFCTPGSVVLSASTAGPWIWSSGQTTSSITLTGSGTRNVTVNGCTSAPVIVTAIAPPATTPVAGSNSPVLCGNTTLNLTSSTIAGVTYSWTGPAGFTSNQQNPALTNVTPAESGSYTVTVTNVGGCTRSASTDVIVSTGTLNGTYTVGVAGNYPTLTAAIAAYNASCLTAPVIFELIDGSYPSETYPLTISNNPSASSINTLTIRPASGVTGIVLTSNNAVATIDLNRARYIIIDGRPGGTGGKDMKIANTHTAGGSSVIRFINDATGNVVCYSILEKAGQGINTADQVVLFSTTAFSTGNDNNNIDNCDLKDGATTYQAGVRCNASTNDGNIISNNNIYNFYNSSASSFGISLPNFTSGTNWNITGNSFYQTVPRAPSSGSPTPVSVFAGNSISGNYVGGSAPQCGGSAWTISGSGAPAFVGIEVNGGSAAYTVSNNTIANILLSGSSTSGIARCNMIQTPSSGSSGMTSNNVIGSSTSYGSITINSAVATPFQSSPERTQITGITGGGTITGNTIGSIVVNCTNSAATAYLRGIEGGTVISHNLVGSETIANSLFLNSSQTTDYSSLVGIQSSGLIDSNIVANLGAQSLYANVTTTGIYTQSATIRGNVVHHYSNGKGIWCNANSTISGNEVYGGRGEPGWGIIFQGMAGSVTKNRVHHINGLGIYIFSTGATGDILVANNMVSLGYYADGTQIEDYYSLTGIVHFLGAGVKYYHNSVYIGGTGLNTFQGYPSGGSIAFSQNGANSPIDVKNNIFVNNRTNGTGTGKHYVIAGIDVANLESDYNLFYAATPSTFASSYPSDLTYAGYQALTGEDVNSLVGVPEFINPDGGLSGADLHINTGAASPANAAGTFIATLTDDMDGDLRNNPPDIGADEFIACIAPVVSCPGNILVSSEPGLCGAIVNYTAATVTGTPAPLVTYSQNSGTPFNAGTTTVTVIATNACGSDSCTFDVTVGDAELPVISCPANITATVNSSGCSALVNYGLPAYSDNCSGATLSQTAGLASGAAFPRGVTTNTFTVTDASGNTASCSFTVTVNSTLTVNAGMDESTFYGYSGDQTVSHTASASGGTGPYTYSWTMNRPLKCNQVNSAGDEIFNGGTCANNICPASGSPVLNPYCTGSASVTVKLIDTTNVHAIVTDALGCISTDSFLVMAIDVRCFSGNSQNQKVLICHHTNKPNSPWVQMCVENNVVPVLVAQGDYIGNCAAREAFISDDLPEWHVNVFPNPAHNKVNVSFMYDKESQYEIRLLDITGKLLQNFNGSTSIGENKMELNLESYAKGFYNLMIIVDGKQKVEKLAIE